MYVRPHSSFVMWLSKPTSEWEACIQVREMRLLPDHSKCGRESASGSWFRDATRT
jgi:hypothetical protein